MGIFDLMLKFGGFLMMPNGLCYLLGRFWKRGTHHGCVAALASGAVLGLYYNVTSTLPAFEPYLPDVVANMHYYHLLPLFALLLTAIFVVVSLVNPPPAPEKIDFLKTDEPVIKDTTPYPWYRKFGFWWVLYLAAFLALYLIF